MFYAKTQLVGISPVAFQLVILVLQYLLATIHFNYTFSIFNYSIFSVSFPYPITAFLLPFTIPLLFLWLTNFLIKKTDYSPKVEDIINTMKNHAAEHRASEIEYFNKDSIYSFGCSNSHILIWFVINLILVWFMPVTTAYLLSMLISGEFMFWLVFYQDSWIANKFYPLMIWFQSYTLLEPEEEHIKTATLAMNKLKELENAR